MKKSFKLKFIDVILENKTNVEGGLSNRIVCNILKSDKYIRIGDFVNFNEQLLLAGQLSLDFDTADTTFDISDKIDYVEIVKEDSKYGTRYNAFIHFHFGYDKKIEIDQAQYMIFDLQFNLAKLGNQTSSVATPTKNK